MAKKWKEEGTSHILRSDPKVLHQINVRYWFLGLHQVTRGTFDIRYTIFASLRSSFQSCLEKEY